MIRKFFKYIGIIALVVAFLGLTGYYTFFKPDLELQQELKAEFGEEFFEITDAGGEIADTGRELAGTGGSNGAPAQPEQAPQKDTLVQKVVKGIEKMTGGVGKTAAGRAPETQPAPVTAGPGNAGITGEQAAPAVLTQAEILGKYEPRFQNLQAQSNGRLETLYAAALAEGRAQKANGTFDRKELARKYIQAGSMLEGAADSQFYSILNALRAELLANNQSADITGEIERQYLSAKSGKRSDLLGRAGL